jgi:hypothetical protein
LVGRILMCANDYCRGILGLGRGFKSYNDRILTPRMKEFSHGDISIRLGGDLPISPAPGISRSTHLLDGLVQKVLRLLASLGSVVPRPEARELGQESPHVVDIESLVHLLDCLGLLSGFGVFYLQPRQGTLGTHHISWDLRKVRGRWSSQG